MGLHSFHYINGSTSDLSVTAIVYVPENGRPRDTIGRLDVVDPDFGDVVSVYIQHPLFELTTVECMSVHGNRQDEVSIHYYNSKR